MSNINVWTIERIDRLRVMWIAGASAAAIANELGGGITRNAVIGKARRLKLPTHIGKSVKKAAARPAPWTGRKQRAPQPAKVIALAPKPAAAPGIASLNAALFDLGARQCRYPTSECGGRILFCGLVTAENESWCAHHRAVVFRAEAVPAPQARKAA